jgi:hypothetical protein
MGASEFFRRTRIVSLRRPAAMSRVPQGVRTGRCLTAEMAGVSDSMGTWSAKHLVQPFIDMFSG